MPLRDISSSDDGKELRSNIYNQWVTDLPDDAVSTEGALVVDGNPTDAAAAYSPCIVNLDDFATWTTVEVNLQYQELNKIYDYFKAAPHDFCVALF